MKIKLFFVVLTIFVATAVFLKANSQEVTSVDIRNVKIKEIPYDMSFVGVNWHNDSEYNNTNDNTYIFSHQDQINSFIKALKDTHIDMIRYPGGENVALYFWNVPSIKIYEAWNRWHKENRKVYIQDAGKYTDRVNYDVFLKFCKQANIKATLQVNTHTYFDVQNTKIIPLKTYQFDSSNKRIWETGKIDWNLVEKQADSVASLVKWVKDNGYSDIVKYWELGNEEYVKVPLSSVYNGSEYGKIAAIYIEKMLKADPSIKFILTGTENPGQIKGDKWRSNWYKWSYDVLTNTELQKYKKNISVISVHTYPFGNTMNDKSLQEFRNNAFYNPHLDVNSIFQDHRKLLNNLGFSHTVFFLNEFNMSFIQSIYSHSWLSAIGNANIIMSCANSSFCQHCDYHQMLNDYWQNDDYYANKGFGMFHYARYFVQPFVSQTVAYVTGFLNDNLKGSVYKTEYNNPDLYVTTVLQNDLLKIIILNKKEKNSAYIKLNDFKNYEYIQNKSVGVDIPDTFTTMQTGDSSSNPSEVAVINTLDDAIKVTKDKFNNYNVDLPKNTITTLIFKKNDQDGKGT